MSAEIASHSKASVPGARRLLAASLIAGLAAGPSLAQNAGPNAAANDQLTEIVVTAQFRSENLQQTPLAITAITGQMIERSQHDQRDRRGG